MIRISCTNCKTILSIDDAFAGGVCRCQHCGTIQTVPAAARGNAAVGSPVVTSGQSIGGSRPLYQNGDPQGSGTGLDDLASIVVSSGLTSNRLTRSAKTADGKGARHNLLLPVVIGSGLLVIVLSFVIIYLLGHNSGAQSPGATSVNPSPQIGATGLLAPVTNSPNFCGVPLKGNIVIYLLDSGSASKDFLGELKDATIKSAGTLTSDRRFEILFWNDGKEGAYPENTTTFATRDSISSAEQAIKDVSGFGQTDIEPALKVAMDQHPDEIVIATGKGFDLSNAWLDNVLTLRGSSQVKMHTFNLIATEGESAPLKRLAAQTGGTYHEITKAQLRAFGQ